MNFVERIMRVMTHVNIGAALGMLAWVLWSGWLVTSGQVEPPYRPQFIGARASGAASMPPVSALAGRTSPPCHEAVRTVPPDAPVHSADDL